MKKAITITHILFPIFIGLIIGGAIGHRPAVWITSLVLLAIDIVVGIILQYVTEKREKELETFIGMVDDFNNFDKKMRTIQANSNAVVLFSPAEIANTLVNLLDAKEVLQFEDYNNVLSMFSIYQMAKDKVPLNFSNYAQYANTVMANFDLIAPYYKFCGDKRLELEKYREEAKSNYRRRAKRLFSEDKFMNDEWEQLLEEFMDKFYNV